MLRVVSALVFALSAAIASPVTAQDFSSVPLPAALPASNGYQDANSPMFVNDVNAVGNDATASAGNGFGLGLGEERSSVADYVAPQLFAPQMEALPQPIPQNAAASSIPSIAVEPPVALDSDLVSSTADQPRPLAAAASGAPSEERGAADDQPRPVAAAASGAPGEDRVASVSAAGTPVRAADIQELPTPKTLAAPAMPTQTPEATTAIPTDATTKAANFKSNETNANSSESSGSGAHIATFFAAGAACVLAVAAVAITRKRKRAHARTPGTPTNELTFFHVQSRLTPPLV